MLALAAELRALRPSVGLVIFSYFNPVLRLGLGRFCAQAAHSGVDGVLITDVIVEEAEEYLAEMHHSGLMPIFLAAPTSSDHRLKMIAGVSQGFVYAISRVGITGAQRIWPRMRAAWWSACAASLSCRLLWVSVSRPPEHVAAVGEFADAAVIGSAVVALIEKAEPGTAPAKVAAFLQGLRQVAIQN